MNRHDIDEIFTLLENPTRRRILRLLSLETHYPLQLARELGISQQAVGKHIKILEDHGLIRSFEEPSHRGGPPRRSYVPTQRITMRVDLGPGVFQTYYLERKQKRDPRHPSPEIPPPSHGTPPGQEGDFKENTGMGPGRSDAAGEGAESELHKEDTSHLREIAMGVRELNREMEDLDTKRLHLMNQRDGLLKEGRGIVIRSIPDYLERKLVYHLLEHGPTSLEEISEVFDRRIKLLREIQRNLEENHGFGWLFES